MGYQTHTVFSILTIVLIIKQFGINLNLRLFSFSNILIYPAVILGSLLPDIDLAHSKISHSLGFVNKILNFLGLEHRGLTHSILGTIIFNLPFYMLYQKDILPYTIFIGILIGYISHLLADMLNPTGIPLFYPLERKKKKYSVFIIKTSSTAETVFRVGVTIAVIFLLSVDLGLITL